MLSALSVESMNAARSAKFRPGDVSTGGNESRGGDEVARLHSVPKTHVAVWRAGVERRTYEYEGKTLEVPEYSVRMKFGGIRKRLALGTALKEEAALKARDIYLSLVAKGWSATLAELAPKSAVEAGRGEGGPTVGEFIAEVERTANLKTKTFRRYAQYFRMLAAHIQRVK